MRANRSAEPVEYARRFEKALWTTDVLPIHDQLAQPTAREKLIQLSREHRVLAAGEGVERMIPDQVQVPVQSRIFQPHQRPGAGIKKIVGDIYRPIRASFQLPWSGLSAAVWGDEGARTGAAPH